jgi:type I restriction enzyme S subunit
MDNMGENRNIPRIRFQNHTVAWEQRKLGELGTTFSGLSGKSKEDFGHGDAEFVTYMNVFSNPISDVRQTECVEIDKKQNEVQYGDVLFTTSSETPEEVGMSSVWLENKPNVYLNSFSFGWRPTVNIDRKYLAYVLRSSTIRRQFVFLAQGISRYNISKNKVMDIPMALPNLSEQRRVGAFFASLDDLIALHQRKLSKVREFKSSMLGKMFPCDGADTPEIRFPGFAVAWEQRKLGDVADVIGGGTPDTGNADYWDGDIDWYAPAEIGESVFVSESRRKITDSGLRGSSAKMLPTGAVLFTSRAGIGNTAILSKPAATNQGFQSIVPHENEADSYFIFARSSELKHYGEKVGAGSTFVEVSGKQMAKMPISMPSLPEQRRIGAFFASLDDLIALHQRKLEKLKQLKQALLQQMFV